MGEQEIETERKQSVGRVVAHFHPRTESSFSLSLSLSFSSGEDNEHLE